MLRSSENNTAEYVNVDGMLKLQLSVLALDNVSCIYKPECVRLD